MLKDIIKILFFLLIKSVPKKNNLLVFGDRAGRRFADNSRYLYLYLNKKIICIPQYKHQEINAKKISILKDLFNNPINEVEFKLRNLDKLNEISQNLKKEGKIDIKFKINNKENELIIKLKNKRHIDRKSINLLKNKDISTIIH